MPRLDRVRVYAGICLTLSLILVSLPSAISAGADQDYVSYTIINELSGRVVDNETGQPIDNVEIWGEIHSRVLKFHIQINGDEYSYELWDDETGEVLVDNEGLSLDSERFVISVSQFLEGEHTYKMRISAPNHESRSVKGKFVAGKQNNIQIELEPGKNDEGDFWLNLDSSKATITRSLKKSGKPVAYDVQVKTWTKNEGNSESGVKVNVKEWKLDHTEKTTTWHADVYHREVSHREWIDTSHWGGWKLSSDFHNSGSGWGAKLIYSAWPDGWRRVSNDEKRYYTKSSSLIFQTRYKYHYVKYSRDWHWFPPGWGSWHPSQNGYESFSSYKGSSFTKGGNFWQNWKKEYSYSGTKRVKVGTRYHWGCRTYTRSWIESGYWDPVYYWNDEGRQSFDPKPSDHGNWDYRNITSTTTSEKVYEWKTVGTKTVSKSEFKANSSQPSNRSPGQRYYEKIDQSGEVSTYEWASDGKDRVSQSEYEAHRNKPDDPSEGSVWYPEKSASPIYEKSWVSKPKQVKVGVEIGTNSDFEGNVLLSVDSPPEIEAYFGAPNGFEDGVELNLSDLNEDGEISTTLVIESPKSKNDSMLGSFPVTIWGTDGESSKSREFTLNVNATFKPPYDDSYVNDSTGELIPGEQYHYANEKEGILMAESLQESIGSSMSNAGITINTTSSQSGKIEVKAKILYVTETGDTAIDDSKANGLVKGVLKVSDGEKEMKLDSSRPSIREQSISLGLEIISQTGLIGKVIGRSGQAYLYLDKLSEELEGLGKSLKGLEDIPKGETWSNWRKSQVTQIVQVQKGEPLSIIVEVQAESLVTGLNPTAYARIAAAVPTIHISKIIND